MKITTPCATCGTLVSRSPSQIRKTVYCSRACEQRASRNKATVQCIVCGKIWEDSASQIANKKYCSIACKLNDPAYRVKLREPRKQAPVTCIVCGKTILLPRSLLIGRQYCSNACKHQDHGNKIGGAKHPRWSGGPKRHYVTPEWRELSKAMRQRDNYTCQRCGKTSCRLEVHHIVPWDICRNDAPDNLVSLCPQCHRKAHNW